MRKSPPPGVEIDLPPKPRRRFFFVALLIMIGGTLGGLIGIVSQAGSLTGASVFEPNGQTPVSLTGEKDYDILLGPYAGQTCTLLDPNARSVPVRADEVDVLFAKLPALAFTATDDGSYIVECSRAQAGQTVVLVAADLTTKAILILALALLTVTSFVVGGLLTIIASIAGARARRRYEEAKADALAEAFARRQAQDLAQAEGPRPVDPRPVAWHSSAPQYPTPDAPPQPAPPTAPAVPPSSAPAHPVPPHPSAPTTSLPGAPPPNAPFPSQPPVRPKFGPNPPVYPPVAPGSRPVRVLPDPPRFLNP